MLESVVAGYPGLDLGIHVVWTPMLGSDNEESARKIGEMFDDPRVKQYWDPNRLLGTSYSANVFPSYLVDIEKGLTAALPADHWWRDHKRDWKNAKPENAPLWDIAFTYEKGAAWAKVPPVPRGMVKQVFFYGEQSDGPSGMFFTDFKKAPADGDWIKEVAVAMTQLTGRAPKKPSRPSVMKPLTPVAGCAGGAKMIRRSVKAQEADYPDTIAGLKARAFVEAFNSGDPEKFRIAAESYRSKSALENRSMDERLEQYRQLHKDWGQLEVRGFEEQDDGSLTLSVKPDRGYSGLNMTFSFEKAGGKIEAIRIMPMMSNDKSSNAAKKGVLGQVTILSDSLDPLREHFNANKHKHRFIAILSPT